MLGLTRSEVYKSFPNKMNENIKFEISEPLEKKEKRFFLKDSETDDENFRPEDLLSKI